MFLKRLAILFYVTVIMFVGSFFLLFSLNALKIDDLISFTYSFYTDKDLRMLTGILAGLILLGNLLFYRSSSINVHRDKVIAFDNPAGRVSVSLMAMEDLLRRLLLRRSEVKDTKVRITASKKGLDVRIRLAMRSEANIPELTFKVQDIVRRKIQDTIGLDEPINISIYVGKIIPEKARISEPLEEPKEPSPTVPFQGYRA